MPTVLHKFTLPEQVDRPVRGRRWRRPIGITRSSSDPLVYSGVSEINLGVERILVVYKRFESIPRVSEKERDDLFTPGLAERVVFGTISFPGNHKHLQAPEAVARTYHFTKSTSL